MSYIGIQSVYSFLKSTLTIDNIIKEAVKRQFETVIIVDDHLHGMFTFFEIAKKQHIKPIWMQRITVTHQDAQVEVLVGIKNQQGYENIILLNQERSLDTILSLDTLLKYQQGLSITLYRIMNCYDDMTYERIVSSFKSLCQDLYIGVAFQTDEDDTFYRDHHIQLSDTYNIKSVLIHFTTHVDESDVETYQNLRQIGGIDIPEGHFHMLDLKDIELLYKKHHHLKQHMQSFIQDHEFKLTFPHFHLPQIPLDKGVTSTQYLESLAFVGLKKRLKNQGKEVSQEYESRLLYELKTIVSLGFEDYFLVVYDLIKYAKTHDIYVGPGRGSVAGSLVAYVLGITEVDPIQYGLLFERFLNPERSTMPDIDMDFPDDKRDDMILYAMNRFGKEHIASIVTYQTFGKKSAIRDLAKLFQLSGTRLQVLTEAIMKDELDPQDHDMMRLYEAVKNIEGLPRQTGTHAAGVILSKEPLNQYIPLTKGPYPFYQTQFEAKELESIGLLKMDFLGIRNLKIIDDVKKEIQKTNPHFSLTSIPLDDDLTYHLLSEANSDGIFQLESYGMRKVLKQLKPSMFEDIVALLALYRPGPMAFIDTYIERRHGQHYEHLHPLLKPYLSSTYGIIIYQEQIMQIAQAFAGYSLAEADLLRRGISKKDANLLKSEADRFVSKACQQGHREEDAQEVYDLIVRFADYGFNRSHSVSYAMVAYQMAYLKANYYIYFMQALLNSVIGSETAIAEYNQDLIKHGMRLLPPDIKKSSDTFQLIDKNTILAPLTIIKSVGQKTVDQLIKHREPEQLNTWIQIKTWLKPHVSERQVIHMIHAGCFDSLEHTRKTLVENSSFDDMDYMLYLDQVTLTTYEEYDLDTLADKEKDALGFHLLHDPNRVIQNMQTMYVGDIETSGKMIINVLSIKKILTKSKEDMAFISCHDGKDTFELTVFPKTYQQYQHILSKGLFKVHVEKQIYKDKTSFIGQSFSAVEKISK